MYLDEKTLIIEMSPHEEEVLDLYHEIFNNNIEGQLISKYKGLIFNKKKLEVPLRLDATFFLQKELDKQSRFSRRLKVRNLLKPDFLKSIESVCVSIDYSSIDDSFVFNISYLPIIEKEAKIIRATFSKLRLRAQELEVSELPYDIYYDFTHFHGEQFINQEDLEECNNALNLLKSEIGDPCIDNYRCFPYDMEKEYSCIRTQGCCGFADEILKCSSGRKYRYGFNYGH